MGAVDLTEPLKMLLDRLGYSKNDVVHMDIHAGGDVYVESVERDTQGFPMASDDGEYVLTNTVRHKVTWEASELP